MKVTVELSEPEISQAVREYLTKAGHIKPNHGVMVTFHGAGDDLVARATIEPMRTDYFDR